MAGLISDWRMEAEQMCRRGATVSAGAVASCADDLERRLNDVELETVTVAEGSEISGYGESALYEMVKDGRLENKPVLLVLYQ